MLFSSLEFILAFLPLTLLAVWAAKRFGGTGAALVTLLAASLVFYAWAVPLYLSLLLGSVLGNFLIGRAIARSGSRLLVGLGIAANLALLGWFKYAALFTATFNALSGAHEAIPHVILPLAISFYTFLQIAYLADCRTGEAGRYGFADYALFVTFFPHLIAGPLVHHRALTPQFREARFASFARPDVAAGLLLFGIGLSKKVLLADSLAPLADAVFDAAHAGIAVSTAQAWLGLFAYTFQIYFDFSGYSDMAIGLSLLFGVSLPVNFLSPYKARDIADFWRRWHITLSQFLRDYLYVPLGGNRKGEARRLVNLFTVMLLGGLWHGASWTFMVWGGLHGAYLCIHRLWQRGPGRTMPLPPLVATALTFLAVVFAWVFFRAESFAAAFAVIASLAGGVDAASVLGSVGPTALLALVIAPLIAWACPNAFEIHRRLAFAEAPGAQRRPMALAGLGAALSLFVLMAWGSYEFIYFQF